MQPTWLWWSSGKDSAWALHALRAAGVPVAALAVTVNRRFERVAMHAVRLELARRQAEAVGVPLHVVEIPHPCSNAEYEEAFAGAVDSARAAGVGAMAFGDLFLADVRAYRERLLAGSGVTPLFPLWGRDTAALAREMVERGLRAVVTCVDPKQLDPAFAGRRFDADFLATLPAGVDPCGERGEFHTFAYAGPMFARPIDVEPGERVERDGFVFADLRPSATLVRALDPARDAAALRACCVELQEVERAMEPDLPPGEAMADAYVARLHERCAACRGRILVALREERIAGFVSLLAEVPPEEPDDPQESRALVADLVVLPEARRLGIGRALLEHAEALARAEGARALYVEVLARNAAARELYRSEGYRERWLALEKRLAAAGSAAPGHVRIAR